jgi:REJ domain
MTTQKPSVNASPVVTNKPFNSISLVPNLKTSEPTTIYPVSLSTTTSKPYSTGSSHLSIQPTGSTIETYPKTTKYYQIFFYGHTTLYGLDPSFLATLEAKTDFRSALAESFRIRLSYIGFVNVTLASANRKLDDGDDEPSGAKLVTDKLTDIRALAVANASYVTWQLFMPLPSSDRTNGTAFYAALTARLTQAAVNGSLLAMIQSSTALTTTQSLSVTENPFSLKFLTSPTGNPTSAPTIIAIIPTVSDITVDNTTRTTITLAVTLVKASVVAGDITGGILYCTALKDGTFPTSIGAVVNAESDTSSSTGASSSIPEGSNFPLTLPIEFAGLQSLQDYSMYCYVETSVGTGNSLKQVVATRTVASTACCRMISLVQFPSFIYGNIAKYKLANPSMYTFSYVLTDPPTVRVRVTPVLFIGGIKSAKIFATPSSAIFSSTSLQTASFYLSAPATMSGNCTIAFAVVGPSASQYKSYNTTIQMLSTVSKIPAPKLLSSRFADSGQAVVISFDSPTDMGGISTTTWPCSTLFSFISAASTSCSWVNASAVIVAFELETVDAIGVTYLAIGDEVTLLSGRLRAFSTSTKNNPAAGTSVIVTLAPLNPLAPTIVLFIPSSIGSCANLTVDATGSYGNGGRLFTSVRWTVTAMVYGATDRILDVSSIQDQLNEHSAVFQVHKPDIILSTALTRATYTFTLVLVNFLGLRSAKTVVVVRAREPLAPSLTVIGPSYMAITASSPLSILSTVSLPGCAPKSTVVKYIWTVRSNDVEIAVTSVSMDPARFSLPPYTLQVDKTYDVTVTATTTASSVSSSVTVYVTHGPVTASVSGGLTRSTPINKALIIDASLSSDSDVSPGVASSLVYEVKFRTTAC